MSNDLAIVEPREAVLGSGAGGPLTAPIPWNLYSDHISYLGPWVLISGGLVLGNATGGNEGNGSINAQSIYINGQLVNPGAFTDYVPLAGASMTGILNLSVSPGPTSPDLQAATKKYVDDKFVGYIQIADAPRDGTNYGRLNGLWSGITDMGTY